MIDCIRFILFPLAIYSTFILNSQAIPWPNSIEQLFFCTDGTNNYDFLLNPNGTLLVKNYASEEVFQGKYRIANGKLALELPSVPFQEEAATAEIQRDLIITFKTPTFSCHSIGHTRGTAIEAYVSCPSIRYLPSISYEKNAFSFTGDHMVKRRRWTELTAANDTLYREIFGIYLIEGRKIFMFFGNSDRDRFLTGTIVDNDTLIIDELEPERGPCKTAN